MKLGCAYGLSLMMALVLGSGARAEAGMGTDPLADACALVSTRPGLRVMHVKGESMEPFFGDGALVVVKAIPFARLQSGSLVVYRNRFGELIAHRVVAVVPGGGWRVKGQANSRADSTLVTAGNLIGVVYATFSAAPVSTPALKAVEVVLAAPAR